MTTGTNPDAGAAARRWAAGVLGVQENASCVEARRAYFSKLRETDFQPTRSLHHALTILNGRPTPAEVTEELLLEDEIQLRAEVESFAEAFLTLPLTQRRECWLALLSKCPSASPLMARLQTLKMGLEVEMLSLPMDQSFRGQLAEHLLQSLPLLPQAQAASRQAFLRRIEAGSAAVDRKSWEQAAHYLMVEWPALAALDQELVEHIAKLGRRLKRRSKMRQRNRRRGRPTSASSGKGSYWWVFVFLAVVGGIMRGALTANKNNSSSWPRASPTFTLPKSGTGLVPYNIPPIDELLDPSKFDVEIVNRRGGRLLCFAPRPQSTISAANGPQANKGQLVWLSEATLNLMDLSPRQIDALFGRAEGRKPPADSPKPLADKVGPTPSNPSQTDKPRQ